MSFLKVRPAANQSAENKHEPHCSRENQIETHLLQVDDKYRLVNPFVLQIRVIRKGL